MKILLSLLLLYSFSLASERKIILGSYIKHFHAVGAFNKAENILTKDPRVSKLMVKNALILKRETIGEYEVVSLSYFTSYIQLLRTLKAVHPYFKDAYVLPPFVQITKIYYIGTETKKVIKPKKVSVHKPKLKKVKPTIVPKKIVKPEAVKVTTIQKKNIVPKKTEPPKKVIIPKKTKDSIEPLLQNTPPIQIQESSSPIWFIAFIVLAVVIFVLLVTFIVTKAIRDRQD